MSALDESGIPLEAVSDAALPGGSLKDRIAARARELEQEPERIILLPVPGYEGILSVQYRALDYRESFKLESRHEKVKDQAEQFLLVAADKLVNACLGIVEPVPSADGVETYKDTGFKWGTKAARELFSSSAKVAALPDTATARQALIAIFPDEEAVVMHAAAYEEQRKAVRESLEKDLAGE